MTDPIRRDTVRSPRRPWRVQRAVSDDDEWLPGWIAHDGAGNGATFATFDEAITYATKRATRRKQTLADRVLGIRTPAPTTVERRRPYHRLTASQVEYAVVLRREGRTWARIAAQLGVNYFTIRTATLKAINNTENQ